MLPPIWLNGSSEKDVNFIQRGVWMPQPKLLDVITMLSRDQIWALLGGRVARDKNSLFIDIDIFVCEGSQKLWNVVT
jgi:hypothetical protein